MRFTSLVQRGSLYYFQQRVPVDIKQYFAVSQIRKSLKTSNHKHALSLVKSLVAKTERLFFMVRSGILTSQQIDFLVQEYMETMLECDKRDRYGIVEFPIDAIALENKNAFQGKYLMNPRKDYDMVTENVEIVEVSGAENLAFHYRCLASGCIEKARKSDFSEIAPVAKFLIKIDGISCDTPSFHMFCDSLLAKEAEAYEIMAQRAESGLNNEYDRSHVTSTLKRRKRLFGLISR